MKQGNWRNWDEIKCHKCNATMYKKYSTKYEDKYYCPACYKEIKEQGIK